MKLKLITIIMILTLCTSYAWAGNKGIFIKGYMYSFLEEINYEAKAVDVKFDDNSTIFLFNNDDTDWTIATEITTTKFVFHGKDDNQITLEELLHCLRSIAPKRFDEITNDLKKEVKE